MIIPRLIAVDPPKVLPFGWAIRRPLRCSYPIVNLFDIVIDGYLLTCGTLMKHQSKSGSSYRLAANPGVTIRGSLSLLAPASRTKTFTLGSSVKRVATTRPAVPPPTITKSNFSEFKKSIESGWMMQDDISMQTRGFESLQYVMSSKGKKEVCRTLAHPVMSHQSPAMFLQASHTYRPGTQKLPMDAPLSMHKGGYFCGDKTVAGHAAVWLPRLGRSWAQGLEATIASTRLANKYHPLQRLSTFENHMGRSHSICRKRCLWEVLGGVFRNTVCQRRKTPITKLSRSENSY